MAWIKFDDNFVSHPKVAGLSDRAFRVHVRAISYAARHLTDGKIPATASTEIRITPKVANELVSAGLWHTDTEAGTYWINDYLAYNPSKKRVEEERAKRNKKLQDWRAKQR